MENNNVKKLVNKVVNEEFINKIKSIKSRIFENKEEMEEGFDDPYVKKERGGRDFSKKEFRPIPKGVIDIRNVDRDDSVTPGKFIQNKFKDIEDLFGDMDDFEGEFSEGDGEACEQCGSNMTEGKCMDCGKSTMYEEELDELGGMDDGHPRFGKKKFPKKMSDDEIERILRGDDDDSDIEIEDKDSPRQIRHRREMGEGKKLSKGQEYIAKQAEPKDKIDSKDFAKLRAKKTETKEGKKFPDLSGDGKVTRKDVLLGRGVKLNGKKKTNESEIYQLTIDGRKHYFTESEMVDVIEKIVIEEAKKGSNPKNVTKYSQDRSKSENEKNIADVTKKMKEYLKNQSKGSYEANPKHFPKGNGELGEMSKKAYKASNAVEEYVENFTAAALENLDYDDIKPNEKWVEDNVVGSSKTGNNPEWANAVETDVNEKRNKIRKDNLLAKMKKKAYNKAPQPVNDEAGENTDKTSKIMMKLESVEDKKVINEIEKMKDLIGYKKKTQ
jgi:hypothetical protein